MKVIITTIFVMYHVIFITHALSAELWSVTEKQAAIAGCRSSIFRQAEQDVLKRHNLDKLPPEVREKSLKALEPVLSTCDCMIEHISKTQSFKDFMANQDQMPAVVNKLVKGPCPVNLKALQHQ